MDAYSHGYLGQFSIISIDEIKFWKVLAMGNEVKFQNKALLKIFKATHTENKVLCMLFVSLINFQWLSPRFSNIWYSYHRMIVTIFSVIIWKKLVNLLSLKFCLSILIASSFCWNVWTNILSLHTCKIYCFQNGVEDMEGIKEVNKHPCT